MSSNEIFIIGAKGQLGLALQQQYPGAKSADIDKLDIADRESVMSFDWSNIKYILNAAAYTNVDGAESPEGRVASWKVNATAVTYLAELAHKSNITLVHISSDYVFDGTIDNHTEEEDFSPLSAYGASKAAGDLTAATAPSHYIVRTSWVIGDGKNFVRTMAGLAEKNISPTVVHDQVGRLTFTSELVRAIDHLLTSNAPYGTYNVSGGGQPASWADITREIFHIRSRRDLTVTNTTTAEYFLGKEGIAPRPLKCTLDLTKIQKTGFNSNDWKLDLIKYLEGEKP